MVAARRKKIVEVSRPLVETPADPAWNVFFNMLEQFEPDMPIERNQPTEQPQCRFECDTSDE